MMIDETKLVKMTAGVSPSTVQTFSSSGTFARSVGVIALSRDCHSHRQTTGDVCVEEITRTIG
jgi:hypothetical protein